MDLPSVIIKDNYADFLNGKEVEATVVSPKHPIEKGMHVMGFHNSIGVKTGVSVPREKQAHYIGVEGMVTDISLHPANGQQIPQVKIIKI